MAHSLDLRKTALLVIDVLVSEDDSLYNPSPEEARVVNKSKELVDAARKAGIPVFFLCDQHIPGIDRELALWGEHGLRGVAKPHPSFEAGTGEHDFIVPKRRYSGFFQTDLDLTLRELGVDTLIACGEDTNICVLHTLADAFYLGYKSILAEDATRTFLCGTQEGATQHMRTCFGTTISSVARVVEALLD